MLFDLDLKAETAAEVLQNLDALVVLPLDVDVAFGTVLERELVDDPDGDESSRVHEVELLLMKDHPEAELARDVDPAVLVLEGGVVGDLL